MMNHQSDTMHNQSLPTIQVQHDDAFVDIPSHPYHTRFFDVVVLTSPPVAPIPSPALSPVQPLALPPAMQEHTRINHRSNFVSIMSYEDAIIIAIIELHDLHIGSSINTIKKHVRDNSIQQANFMNRTISSSTATATSRNSHNSNNNNHLKNSLFLAALKSLLDKKVIVPYSKYASFVKKTCLSSCCFKLSREYIKKRFQVFLLNRHKLLLSKDKYYKEDKKDKDCKKRMNKKYTKERKQKIPTVRIKPSLSKIRLVDQNAGGVLVEKNKNKNNVKTVVSGMMDLDDVVDEETQKRYILLLKLGLHLKEVFITKRKNLCKKMKKNLHYKKIVSMG